MDAVISRLTTDSATILNVLLRDSFKLDKLYANTYISFSMLYDEMYIDLQHILLVITGLDLAKTCCFLMFFFYKNSVRTS